MFAYLDVPADAVELAVRLAHFLPRLAEGRHVLHQRREVGVQLAELDVARPHGAVALRLLEHHVVHQQVRARQLVRRHLAPNTNTGWNHNA
eukprot:5187092-Pyramimonas_sp.AAC.1